MSYANGTQFYNLPQTVGTDKRDWFDENQAFADVDAALHTAVTGQAADAEAIATINAKLLDDEADIAALQTTSGTHTTQIATLQTTVNAQASQIADVRQDSEDMICAYNEGAAETSTHAYEIGDYFIYNDVLYKATAAIAIGDTIVPNTNCSATNATTEIAQLNSDLADVKKVLHLQNVTSDGTYGLIALTGLDNSDRVINVICDSGYTGLPMLFKDGDVYTWNALILNVSLDIQKNKAINDVYVTYIEGH